MRFRNAVIKEDQPWHVNVLRAIVAPFVLVWALVWALIFVFHSYHKHMKFFEKHHPNMDEETRKARVMENVDRDLSRATRR